MWHYVIITGATKGFGKAIALRIAKVISSPVWFSISGRNSKELEETKNAILNIRTGKDTNCDITIADLSELKDLESSSANMLKDFDHFTKCGVTISKILFVNNAGSLGPLTYIGTGAGCDLSLMTAAYNLNVTAFCFLTSEFMRKYKNKAQLTICNISSLCAIQAFDSWGIYCAGKAARDMFFKVLAAENKEANVRILNYAPGPLDTDMQKEIRECETAHKETQEYFRELKAKNQLVSVEDSAAKFIAVIFGDEYDNGAHIDFYDVKNVCTKCSCANCQCGENCNCSQAKSSCDNNSPDKKKTASSMCACTTCECGENCQCTAAKEPQCNACINFVTEKKESKN